MRHLFLLSAAFVATLSKAINVVSIANGPWNSPATWDCGCVPGFFDNVTVMTDVTLEGNIVFGQPLVHVLASGSLIMNDTGSVALVGAAFVNDGEVRFLGTSTNAGGFTNMGLTRFGGNFTNDGTLVIGGGHVEVTGDFLNLDELSGTGGLCVAQFTANEGTITGTLDICDATPTTTVAPILDQNTGTVDASVTYCASGGCANGISEVSTFVPVVATCSEGVRISGLSAQGAQMEVIDPAGHVVLHERVNGSAGLVPFHGRSGGIYSVVLRNGSYQRVIRVAWMQRD